MNWPADGQFNPESDNLRPSGYQKNSALLEDMKKEIWAIFYHKISTNNEPQHDYCPAGEANWCRWRITEALEELDDYQHNPPYPPAVQEVIRPIYE